MWGRMWRRPEVMQGKYTIVTYQINIEGGGPGKYSPLRFVLQLPEGEARCRADNHREMQTE
jgi:hypothetical protein